MSKKIIDEIRLLSAEQVEAANSGHPGMPLGAAPLIYTLYARAMKYSPKNPNWLNRDRFVLSAGHGSALLYSTLHLFGGKILLNDLKAFRQKGSRTPGHPESMLTPGVDMSTGPLGQGIANAVGLAIAEAKLAQEFNRDGINIFDHYTFVLHGDGCLMEGVSYEACSLAGHLGLGKLIMLYDSNDITIEGSTANAFTEDIRGRFESMGWDYYFVPDGNDVDAIERAVELAKKTDKPSLIEVKTKIGYGSKSVEGQAKAHGAPLGAAGIKELYEFLGVPDRTPFDVAKDVYDELEPLKNALNLKEVQWNEMLLEYKTKYPEMYAKYEAWMGAGEADINLAPRAAATREFGGEALNVAYSQLPNLTGGSADLAPTNLTQIKDSGYMQKGAMACANIHFGIREHAMGAIVNGMQSHGGLRAFGSTFLSFMNYMTPAIRMAAIMEIPSLFVFTHDSIGVGEDGPTHQPVDQLASLRAIPRLNVFRPADAAETAACYEMALNDSHTPSAIVLSRQKVAVCEGTCKVRAKQGAYILYEGTKPVVNIVATGSELGLAIDAAKILESKEIMCRVVSMPSMNVFDRQPEEYKNKVFSKSLPTVSIEAASTYGWKKYADLCIGVDDFGISAPSSDVFSYFQLTPELIADRIEKFLE